jgi:hypothetical protein
LLHLFLLALHLLLCVPDPLIRRSILCYHVLTWKHLCVAPLPLLCRPAFSELLLELQEQLQALRRVQQAPPSLRNSASGIATDTEPSSTTVASAEELTADA